MMSLQATLWRSVIIPEMIVYRHPERIWRALSASSKLLTGWTQKAGGHFKAGSMFLIKKGACAVAQDIVLHMERKFGHAPESVANALVAVWNSTLVIRVAPCF